MKNEEFQRIVLEELRDLKVGQGRLEVRMDKIEDKVGKLEEGQGGILHSLDGLIEQTASLTEFRVEVNAKLDRIIDENRVFKEIIGRHEVDIEMLKKKIC